MLRPVVGSADELIAQAGACRSAGRLVEAEALLRLAVQLAPNSVAALTNHGLLLSELGRHRDAAALQRRAVALAPGFAPAWINLALALRLAGDTAGAEHAEARAAALDPDSPQTRVAAGLADHARGRPFEAIDAYRVALRAAPAVPETWINLALALSDTGDGGGCRQALEQALELRPWDRRAWSNLLMSSHYQPGLAAADLRDLAARAGGAWPSQRERPAPRADRAGPLRVGYLSADLCAHPVGWLLGPVLRAHDSAAVEVHVFDHRIGPDEGDAVTARLRSAAPHWHRVGELDDTQLAGCIADAGIDVLVDLSGHTQGNRLGVLARRPAPVQLCWLGWFGSTGLPAVDAVVLGVHAAPAEAEAAYTEEIERVGPIHFAYDPPDGAPPLVPAPSASRGHVTFGCFNNPAKIGNAVVQAWSQLLAALPDSRLVLKWKTLAEPEFARHVGRRFAAHGIAAQRLELRAASPHAQMLAEYGDIDVALDPFPFTGLTTTLEALWMGVPVVTLPMQRTVSRQSLAVLSAIGLDGWAHATPGGYVAGALELAADLPLRQALRSAGAQGLRARMRASALMDGTALARALETMYTRRLHAARGGLPAAEPTPRPAP